MVEFFSSEQWMWAGLVMVCLALFFIIQNYRWEKQDEEARRLLDKKRKEGMARIRSDLYKAIVELENEIGERRLPKGAMDVLYNVYGSLGREGKRR